MWKQFLSKFPRKSPRSDPDSTRSPNSVSNTPSLGPNSHGPATSSAKRASAAVFPSSVIAGIEPLLAFKDVPSSERINLFISKLSLCCVVFDFTDPSKNAQEKELKRATLLELLAFISDNPPKLSEPVILSSCKMCSINLFRVLPPNSHSKVRSQPENDNEDEPMFEPAWAHLQIVYNFLLKLITSPSFETKTAKKYIDHSFISRIIDLFDSDDPRERDCLKAILHRIYGKFMIHRPFIRKTMCNVFYRFVFEIEKHNGIAELLEIFGSVITGFALPLKEEHKMFFWRALIPLHRPKSLGVYFQQLSYCVIQFVEKEPKLASGVIMALLRCWPVTNSQKEVMFLGEIEEILDMISVGEFQKIMVSLFSRIKHCISSYNFQVAERALFLWNNDQIVSLVSHNRRVILPIIIPALEINAQSHWNPSVVNLTANVRKMLTEMDDVLASSCICSFREEQAKSSSVIEKRRRVWEHLENTASLQPVAENTAVLVTR